MNTSDPVPCSKSCTFHTGLDDRHHPPLRPCKCTSRLVPGRWCVRLPASQMTFCVIARALSGSSNHFPSHFPTTKYCKIKKAEDFSSAFFRLVPSPRYFAKAKLTEAGSQFPVRC